QLSPNSDGSFQFTFTAGGNLWKLNGDYMLEVKYGGDTSEIAINYVGGKQIISQPEPPVDKEPEPPVDKEPEPPVDKEPEPPVDKEPTCGAGTELVNGICQVVMDKEPEANGGGCLIATAAYGTELAPQVQFLREIRDNTVMSTVYGAAFMTGFNQLYYSFSPTIADMERENPMFQKVVRAFITPMVSSLSIMTFAEDGSEFEVLGLGISVIALNLGMYIAAPALIGFKVHHHFKSRK
ncbi:MAG: CFI-box-CTERM domain-containing protein, partial [Nitrosopumilus sp.]